MRNEIENLKQQYFGHKNEYKKLMAKYIESNQDKEQLDKLIKAGEESVKLSTKIDYHLLKWSEKVDDEVQRVNDQFESNLIMLKVYIEDYQLTLKKMEPLFEGTLEAMEKIFKMVGEIKK